MIRLIAILALLSGASAFADDPTPVDDLSAIVAPKECSGSGKRNDPFVFDASTKCVLKLTGKSASVVWDLEDSPKDSEPIDRVLIFSLSEPGDYLAIATFDGGFAKAWFTIKGANGPPKPADALAAKLRAALAGADAAKDAVQFAEIVRGIADQIEASPPKVHKSLKALFDKTLAATNWPAGKYPLLPDLWRSVIPSAEETKELSSDELAGIVASMRLLQKTGEAIANGK